MYQHLARSNRKAREALRPKWFPPQLAYLRDWVYELHGRSGISQVGVAPLSWTTLRHWRAERGLMLRDWEVSALMQLDGVLCNPGSFDEKPADGER